MRQYTEFWDETKMQRYRCGAVTIPINQWCGYCAHKVYRSNKANQHECIPLSLLVIFLLYLNSRGHNHTAQDNRHVLIRSSLLHLYLIGFVGLIPNVWLKLSAHSEAPLMLFFFSSSAWAGVTHRHLHTDTLTSVLILRSWSSLWETARRCVYWQGNHSSLQLRNDNVPVTMTAIFVALVVCWTTRGRVIGGTHGQMPVLG